MTERRCRCRYTHVEGFSKHEPGCPMLLPQPVVPRDPHRLPTAAVVGQLTGAEPTRTRVDDDDPEMLYGIPEAIGTSEDFPLTHRPGEYMGQARTTSPLGALLPLHDAPRMTLEPLREATPPSLVELVCTDVRTRVKGIGADSIPRGPDQLLSAYGTLIDVLLDLRRFIQKRDGK